MRKPSEYVDLVLVDVFIVTNKLLQHIGHIFICIVLSLTICISSQAQRLYRQGWLSLGYAPQFLRSSLGGGARINQGVQLSYLSEGVRFSLGGRVQTSFTSFVDRQASAVSSRPLIEAGPLLQLPFGRGRARRWRPYISLEAGPAIYESQVYGFAGGGMGLSYRKKDWTVSLEGGYKPLIGQGLIRPWTLSLNIGGLISRRHPSASKSAVHPEVATTATPPSDRDGDGILDSLDRCPDLKGLAQFEGCPDTDGDGLPDFKDDCPREPGPLKYRGCPIPDSDHDGLNDDEDSCALVPGPRSNRGCPLPMDSIKGSLDVLGAQILFATGSDQINPESYPILDRIIALLKQYPQLQVLIEGHTDNVGSGASNQDLSQRRAEAVMTYLAGRGVDRRKLSAKGYGATRPLQSNATEAGRRQNRRVAFALSQ